MVDLCCSLLVTIVSGLVSFFFFGANEEGGHRFNSFRGQLVVIQRKGLCHIAGPPSCKFMHFSHQSEMGLLRTNHHFFWKENSQVRFLALRISIIIQLLEVAMCYRKKMRVKRPESKSAIN